MAQITPFTWYKQESAPAFAGMKGDISFDVCDSFASEGGVNPGEAVIRGTDAAFQCKAASTTGDGAKVIGIAVHVHREPATGSNKYYEAGYCLPVMSFGDVYVKAGGDVTAGDAVAVVLATGVFVKNPSTTTAGTEKIDGMTFIDSGASGDLVRIRVRK